MISSLNSVDDLRKRTHRKFSKNVVPRVYKHYEKLISKHAKDIQKGDRRVLSEIQKDLKSTSIDSYIVSQLKELWNLSYLLGKETAETGQASFSTAIKMSSFAEPEDTALGIRIRERNNEQRRITEEFEGSPLSASEFGKTYLKNRNTEVARNFTKTYETRMINSVSEYMAGENKLDNELDLVRSLSPKPFGELTPEELRAYRGRRGSSLREVYGLNKEVIDDPAAYDNRKFDVRGRIERIAFTESAAAFNLGRLEEHIKTGYTRFFWRTSPLEQNCFLCDDKDGDIVTLNDLAATVIDISNVGWTDYSQVYTRATKTAIGRTPVTGRSYNNTTVVFPPAHPNCACYLQPDKSSKRLRAEVAMAVFLRNVQQTATNVAQVAGKTLFWTTAATAGVGALTWGAAELEAEYERRLVQQQLDDESAFDLIYKTSKTLATGLIVGTYLFNHPLIKNLIKDTKQFGVGNAINNLITGVEREVKTTVENTTNELIERSLLKAEDELKERLKELQQKVAEEIKEKAKTPQELLSDLWDTENELDEESDLQTLNDSQRVRDLRSMSLGVSSSAELAKAFKSDMVRAQYHDLIALKLREQLFSKLAPYELMEFAKMSEKQVNLPHLVNKYGISRGREVYNLWNAIESHLQRGELVHAPAQPSMLVHAPRQKTNIIKAVKTDGTPVVYKPTPTTLGFRNRFYGPALDDVVNSSGSVLAEAGVPDGFPSKGKLVKGLTAARRRAKKNLSWSEHRQLIYAELRNAGLTDKETSSWIDFLSRNYPTSRQDMPGSKTVAIRLEGMTSSPSALPGKVVDGRFVIEGTPISSAMAPYTNQGEVNRLIDRAYQLRQGIVSNPNHIFTGQLDELLTDVDGAIELFENNGNAFYAEQLRALRGDTASLKRAAEKSYQREAPLLERMDQMPLRLPEIVYAQPVNQAETLEVQNLNHTLRENQRQFQTAYDDAVDSLDLSLKRASGYRVNIPLQEEHEQVTNVFKLEAPRANDDIDDIRFELDRIRESLTNPFGYAGKYRYIDSARSSRRSKNIDSQLEIAYKKLVRKKEKLLSLEVRGEKLVKRLKREKKRLEAQLNKGVNYFEGKNGKAKLERLDATLQSYIDTLKAQEKKLPKGVSERNRDDVKLQRTAIQRQIERLQQRRDALVNDERRFEVLNDLKADVARTDNLINSLENVFNFKPQIAKIDDILNNQLSLIKVTRQKTIKVGNNKYFPEKPNRNELKALQDIYRIEGIQDELGVDLRKLQADVKKDFKAIEKSTNRSANSAKTALAPHYMMSKNERHKGEYSAFQGRMYDLAYKEGIMFVPVGEDAVEERMVSKIDVFNNALARANELQDKIMKLSQSFSAEQLFILSSDIESMMGVPKPVDNVSALKKVRGVHFLPEDRIIDAESIDDFFDAKIKTIKNLAKEYDAAISAVNQNDYVAQAGALLEKEQKRLNRFIGEKGTITKAKKRLQASQAITQSKIAQTYDVQILRIQRSALNPADSTRLIDQLRADKTALLENTKQEYNDRLRSLVDMEREIKNIYDGLERQKTDIVQGQELVVPKRKTAPVAKEILELNLASKELAAPNERVEVTRITRPNGKDVDPDFNKKFPSDLTPAQLGYAWKQRFTEYNTIYERRTRQVSFGLPERVIAQTTLGDVRVGDTLTKKEIIAASKKDPKSRKPKKADYLTEDDFYTLEDIYFKLAAPGTHVPKKMHRYLKKVKASPLRQQSMTDTFDRIRRLSYEQLKDLNLAGDITEGEFNRWRAVRKKLANIYGEEIPDVTDAPLTEQDLNELRNAGNRFLDGVLKTGDKSGSRQKRLMVEAALTGVDKSFSEMMRNQYEYRNIRKLAHENLVKYNEMIDDLNEVLVDDPDVDFFEKINIEAYTQLGTQKFLSKLNMNPLPEDHPEHDQYPGSAAIRALMLNIKPGKAQAGIINTAQELQEIQETIKDLQAEAENNRNRFRTLDKTIRTAGFSEQYKAAEFVRPKLLIGKRQVA